MKVLLWIVVTVLVVFLIVAIVDPRLANEIVNTITGN